MHLDISIRLQLEKVKKAREDFKALRLNYSSTQRSLQNSTTKSSKSSLANIRLANPINISNFKNIETKSSKAIQAKKPNFEPLDISCCFIMNVKKLKSELHKVFKKTDMQVQFEVSAHLNSFN